MSRSSLALIFLLASTACAKRASDGRVPDPVAPPRSAFQVYPAEQVAGIKDPHDWNGKALCQRCHQPDLTLVADVNALCRQCHSFLHKSHPVDVVQKTAIEGEKLPLLPGGKLACHTCHDPHQGKVVLRRPFNQ